MTRSYKRGDAAAYWAWLDKQPPAVARVAAQFRPWEYYQLDGCEIYAQIVSYDLSGTLLDVQREDGVVLTVTPTQFSLAGLMLDELPEDRLYRALDAA